MLSPRPLGGSSKTCTFTSLSAHINCPTAHHALSRTLQNGERIAIARESAKRVGPMHEQHHLPRREKRQMPSCRWRRSKYFVSRYSTLYTVRKPHQRHVLIAHCTSREHTTWHSLPSERSTNGAQEERFLCKRFSPPLRLYLPRRETGAFLVDLPKKSSLQASGLIVGAAIRFAMLPVPPPPQKFLSAEMGATVACPATAKQDAWHKSDHSNDARTRLLTIIGSIQLTAPVHCINARTTSEPTLRGVVAEAACKRCPDVKLDVRKDRTRKKKRTRDPSFGASWGKTTSPIYPRR